MLTLVKFADDMALVAHLQDENSFAEYFLQLGLSNLRFTENFLYLNTSKSKELVFDSRKEKQSFIPVTTDQQSVEAASSFKYLGTVLDPKLSLNDKEVPEFRSQKPCPGV